MRRAALSAADTLLVLGASGSSGSAAVQLAKALGARVIAVAGGEEKGRFCLGLGPPTRSSTIGQRTSPRPRGG